MCEAVVFLAMFFSMQKQSQIFHRMTGNMFYFPVTNPYSKDIFCVTEAGERKTP